MPKLKEGPPVSRVERDLKNDYSKSSEGPLYLLRAQGPKDPQSMLLYRTIRRICKANRETLRHKCHAEK